MTQYTATICPECGYCWVIKDSPDTSKCGRCGKTHQYKNLKVLHKSENKKKARVVRAAAQAEADGNKEMFDRAMENGAITTEVDGVVDVEALLEQSGVDVSEVQAASERAENQRTRKSDKQAVKDAIQTCSPATEENITDEAGDYGVSEEKVSRMLKKLELSGDVLCDSSGEYRFV